MSRLQISVLPTLIELAYKNSSSSNVLNDMLEAANLQDLEKIAADKVRAMLALSGTDRRVADIDMEMWYGHPVAKVRIAALMGVDAADDGDYRFGIVTRALGDKHVDVRGMAAVISFHIGARAMTPELRKVALEVAARGNAPAETLVRYAARALRDGTGDGKLEMDILVAACIRETRACEMSIQALGTLAHKDPRTLEHLAQLLTAATSGWTRNCVETALRQAAGIEEQD